MRPHPSPFTSNCNLLALEKFNNLLREAKPDRIGEKFSVVLGDHNNLGSMKNTETNKNKEHLQDALLPWVGAKSLE